MRVLAAERDNSLAKNFQQSVEIGSFAGKRRIEPVANPVGRHVTIHAAIAEIAEVIGHELNNGITPIPYLVGGRLKHFGYYTRKEWRVQIADCGYRIDETVE